MSGLLRRLARQVVGPAPARVRTMARLPFAPLPELRQPEQAPPSPVAASHAEPAAAAGSSIQPVIAAGAPRAADANPPRATASAAAAGTSGAASVPPAVRAGEPGLAESFEALPADETTQPPAPLLSEAREPARPGAAAGGARPAGNAPVLGVPPPIVATHAGMPRPPDALPAFGEPAAAPSAREDRRDVARLESPRDEPAAVHVHIGRIEVTALHEAAPAPRRPRTGPQPMPLADYLARRHRSRS